LPFLGSAGASSPAYTQPVPLGGGGGEPSIRNPLSGKQVAAYISAPAGTGSNFWHVDETANADGSYTLKPSAPQQPDLGTGGGDSELSLSRTPDPATGCETIAYSGLHNIDLLDNFTTNKSSDCGHSFVSPPNLYATQNTATDRQWQTFDGSKTNLLIYHKVDTSQIVVSRSFDGGYTYDSTSTGAITSVAGIIDPATYPSVFNSNQVGNITTDYAHPVAGATYPTSGEQVHRLFAIFEGPRDPQDNLQAQVDTTAPGANFNHNDTVYVARSDDGGVTWVDHPVYSTDPSSKRELNLLFPVVSVDTAGTVYAMWSDQLHVQYAFSTDGGSTWSKAYQVNTDNPNLSNGGTADIFPWMAAGSPGKVDVVWYHGAGGAAGANTNYRDPGDPKTAWTVASAQLFKADAKNASGVPTPNVQSYSTAISPVIHHGDICNNGLNCDLLGGDRTLLDFFQNSVDANGCNNVAYASDQATPGSSTINYIRQNGGSSVFTGKTCPAKRIVVPKPPQGTSCPGPQILDPYGDATSSVQVQPQGGNVDTQDIGSVLFTAPDSTHVRVTVKVKNLSALPPLGTVSQEHEVFWKYAGKTWYAHESENAPGLPTYDVGYLAADGSETSSGTPDGQFNTGDNGTVVFTILRSQMGSPTNEAALTGPYAETRGGFLVQGAGVHYVAAIDRAPDTGTGATYFVGRTCATRQSSGGVVSGAGSGAGSGNGNGSGGSLAATGGDAVLPAAGLFIIAAALWSRRRVVR
jgi:hypothetical protein